MFRRIALVCAVLVAGSVVGSEPVAHAATVGTGDCASTVDTAAGVSSSVAVDGACIVVFAAAPTSPTTSTQYAVRTWTVPAGINAVDVLVVAGGGGGGMSNGSTPTGGGGGGGGIVLATAFAVTPSSSITIWNGYGGQGGNCSPGNPGGNSKFGSLVAVGGGFGGGCGPAYGGPGGNAGGAHWGQPQGTSTQATSGTASNGTNITAYGNSGGKSYPHGTAGDAVSAGGGGGGGATQIGGDATQPGANSSSGVGGIGGEGLANNWRTGSNVVYGSGGGGQARAVQGAGGTNGGTASGTNAAGGAGIDAVDETGAGGGGGYRQGGGRAGDGGSGIVIVRYYVNTTPANTASPTVSGTTTNGQALTGTQGTWTGYPAPTYTYRWKRASTANGSYTNITGATALAYTLTDDDIDKYLKFEVTATNANGTVVATSIATAQIADMVRPSTTTTTTTTTSTTTTTTPTSTTTSPSLANTGTTTTTGPALVIEVSAPTTTVAPQTTSISPPSTAIKVFSVTSTTRPAASPTEVAVAATPTSTTTTIPSTTTTSTTPAPTVRAVATGQAVAEIDGQESPTSIQRVDNQIVVQVGPINATIGSVTGDGDAGALDNEGNVRLRPGDSVRIKATGFEPDSVVELWLFSTPVRLGTATVTKDGSVTGDFTVPDATATGAHRIAIVARTSDGKSATLAIGILVGEWEKSANITVWLIVLPIIAAVVGALVLPATRRRRRSRAVVA